MSKEWWKWDDFIVNVNFHCLKDFGNVHKTLLISLDTQKWHTRGKKSSPLDSNKNLHTFVSNESLPIQSDLSIDIAHIFLWILEWQQNT